MLIKMIPGIVLHIFNNNNHNQNRSIIITAIEIVNNV